MRWTALASAPPGSQTIALCNMSLILYSSQRDSDIVRPVRLVYYAQPCTRAFATVETIALYNESGEERRRPRSQPNSRQDGTAFWQDESYDHWVRDQRELNRIVRYIECNQSRPVWSSELRTGSGRVRRCGLKLGRSGICPTILHTPLSNASAARRSVKPIAPFAPLRSHPDPCCGRRVPGEAPPRLSCPSPAAPSPG